jgi:hypothetical protein
MLMAMMGERSSWCHLDRQWGWDVLTAMGENKNSGQDYEQD